MGGTSQVNQLGGVLSTQFVHGCSRMAIDPRPAGVGGGVPGLCMAVVVWP